MDNYYKILLEKVKQTDTNGSTYVYTDSLNDLISVFDLSNRLENIMRLEQQVLDSNKSNKLPVNPSTSEIDFYYKIKSSVDKFKSGRYELFIQMQAILSKYGIVVKPEDLQEILKSTDFI